MLATFISSKEVADEFCILTKKAGKSFLAGTEKNDCNYYNPIFFHRSFL